MTTIGDITELNINQDRLWESLMQLAQVGSYTDESHEGLVWYKRLIAPRPSVRGWSRPPTVGDWGQCVRHIRLSGRR